MLVAEGLITEAEIADTLAEQLSLERVDLEKTYVEQEVARSIPKEVALEIYCDPDLYAR